MTNAAGQRKKGGERTANNYVEFSELIENLTAEEKTWVEQELRCPTDIAGMTDENGDMTAPYEEWLKEHPIGEPEAPDDWPGFGCVLEEDAGKYDMWLKAQGDEGSNIENLAIFVQNFIKKFRPNMVFALTYSCTCSKPRVGEFGGGFLVVSRDAIEGGDTWSAAHAMQMELYKRAGIKLYYVKCEQCVYRLGPFESKEIAEMQLKKNHESRPDHAPVIEEE